MESVGTQVGLCLPELELRLGSCHGDETAGIAVETQSLALAGSTYVSV
jgi:hypothetical protein